MATPDHRAARDKAPYRFAHFSPSIMLGDLRFSRSALRPGDRLPNIALTLSDGTATSLYELAAGKPLLLFTGSITCPMTVSSIDHLRELQRKLAGALTIALVYVREAHPGENYPQPSGLAQKMANARQFQGDYSIEFPVIVDDIEGTLHHLLDVLPNSAHVLNGTGLLLAQSLWTGDEIWLNGVAQVVRGAVTDNNQSISQRMLRPFLVGAGFMDETLKRAGRRAYRELIFGAPPISLLAKTAAMLRFVSPPRRGVAAAGVLVSLFILLALTLVLVS